MDREVRHLWLKRKINYTFATKFQLHVLMSKADKLLNRLKERPRDFTYNELKALLSHFGYSEIRKSGSARAFVHHQSMHVIRIHKPHPHNTLKMYQVNEILDELSKQGY